MKYYLPLLLLLTASACSTVRQLPSTDSTKVEVRVVEKIVRDTAWLELPVIIEKRTTFDTVSILENKYAKSEAIVSTGVLVHSLATKPVREPVTVETREIVRDSIVYRDRVQTQSVEVEKELTAWQKFQMRLGFVTSLLLVIVVIYSIFLIINHFKS